MAGNNAAANAAAANAANAAAANNAAAVPNMMDIENDIAEGMADLRVEMSNNMNQKIAITLAVVVVVIYEPVSGRHMFKDPHEIASSLVRPQALLASLAQTDITSNNIGYNQAAEKHLFINCMN